MMAMGPMLRMTPGNWDEHLELGHDDHQFPSCSAGFQTAGVRACHDDVMDSFAVRRVSEDKHQESERERTRPRVWAT